MTPNGAVVLVTGAASGIGLACVTRFAAAGAKVVATDVATAAATAAAGDGAQAAGRATVEFHRLDVTDPESWTSVVAEIASEHGRLDVVLLNAGIRLGQGDISRLSHDDYHRLIDINQHGVFYGVKSTIDLLQESGGGDIVVTASRASLGPLSNDLAYSMSKHAVAGLVRSIAPDLITRGIRINAICPATVDTGFLTAGRRELEAAGITVMEPDEVAEGVSVILESGRTGECFVQLPGDPPMPFPFAPVPGR